MAIRGGSWSIGGFRLPEFGITERIQNIVQPQAPRTYQGGSNLFGPQPQPQAQAPRPVYGPQRPTGQVSSVSTGPVYSGGGGGGGGQSQAPASQQQSASQDNSQQYQEQAPEAPSIDFEDQFDAVMQAGIRIGIIQP